VLTAEATSFRERKNKTEQNGEKLKSHEGVEEKKSYWKELPRRRIWRRVIWIVIYRLIKYLLRTGREENEMDGIIILVYFTCYHIIIIILLLLIGANRCNISWKTGINQMNTMCYNFEIYIFFDLKIKNWRDIVFYYGFVVFQFNFPYCLLQYKLLNNRRL